MKTEGLLQCSQEPATSPCFQPHESNQFPNPYFSQIKFNIKLIFLYLRLGLASGLFEFPNKILYESVTSSCALHALTLLSSSV
jgi:hypothetical protein